MTDVIPDLWNDGETAGFSEERLLLYRSNLLGRDLRITNYAGGNTSAKVRAKDPLTGEGVTVLWVKGSGGDLGSLKLDGFATLYLEKILSLERHYAGDAHEDAMVPYLAHCTFDLNPRAASIDTPLHAFVPAAHVDHLHPDAVAAIAAAKDGEALTRRVYGGEIGWIPWKRPGFALGLVLREKLRREPALKGVVLGGHGLLTWGPTSRKCYATSLEVIRRAEEFVKEAEVRKPSFGGQRIRPLGPEDRRSYAAAFLPPLRGKLSTKERKVGHFCDAAPVLEFAGSKDAARLAALGTSCPDHFLRTKVKPLFIDADPNSSRPEAVVSLLDDLLPAYVADYAAYYERCREPDSPPIRDPFPVVVLVPGVGMLTFAKEKAIARQAAEFYVNAINVIRGSEAVGSYAGLPEKEAFRIEYWVLEEAKLRRLPPERALSRRVALVTGGAGGIGGAAASRLLEDGAAVVLADIDEAALEAAAERMIARFGRDAVRSVRCDVTNEESVGTALRTAVLEYGGLDALVLSAGIASAAPVDETSLALWERNMGVLATGYFLVAREAFRLMKAQRLGGSIVVVASKNALVASPGASAYCAAKAAELHLARCLALEGAAHGIRVNVVNPDAVIRGSKIWSGEWRKERAEAYKIDEKDLEEHYRNRSLLKRSVLPEDVAEAVHFFVSERSSKSTGNILNVDAGNAAAFPR